MSDIKDLIRPKGLPLTFAIFYGVGFGLFAVELTRPLFVILTPYSLVLSTFAFLWFHKQWNVKTTMALLIVFIFSIAIEIIGVQTGVVFGEYAYQEGLGIKIAGAPILIGVNWILLVYGSNAIVGSYTDNKTLKVIIGSALMVVFDLILELAAPLFNMWEFNGGIPPFRNYLMWFVFAAVFHIVFEVFKVNTRNRTARALFVTQFFFFVAVVVYS